MPCKLKLIAGTTDFEGKTGDEVTLVLKEHIGVVLIASAEYNGKQHVPANQAVAKVKLTIATGSNTLKMVFVFTASTSGRGELRETDGPDSQFLRALAGHEPFHAIKIVGI